MGIKIKFFVVAVSTLTLLASCAVTTKMTEGSSETFANTTEASSKFTSSTFPRGDDDEDSANATEYIRINMARLRANMAVGQGEYLSNLAVLLDIHESKRPAFFQMTKTKFDVLFSSPKTPAEELLGKLYIEISHMPVT
jgi:hypothetical protein